MKINSVFLAGTMQGANQGTGFVDQHYRDKIKILFKKYYPEIKVYCPLEKMVEKFGNDVSELKRLISTLSQNSIIFPHKIDARLRETVKVFHELLQQASTSDLIIAYLPNHEPSMGTAMEMIQAYKNNIPIISITGMSQNLSILSTSTIIVSDLIEFEKVLQNKLLESF